MTLEKDDAIKLVIYLRGEEQQYRFDARHFYGSDTTARAEKVQKERQNSCLRFAERLKKWAIGIECEI